MFDNFTVWLGHQTTHTGNLTHLCGGTAGAGVSHHVYGVNVTMIDFRNILHHLIGNLIRTGSPDINDFVIFLALGNQTVLILLFKFLNLSFGFGNQSGFGFRNNQIVFTERNTSLACIRKPKGHNLVDKQNRFFLAAVTINNINDFTDFFLFNQTVNQRERNILMLRQNLRNDNASRRCVNNAVFDFAVIGNIFHSAFDFSMQINRFGIQSQLNFVKVCKN